jgi:putative alpha-1,2-mannosidase
VAPGVVIADTSLDKFHETATAQRSDELARAYVHATNTADEQAFDTVLARGFLSYSRDGVRSRTAIKKHYRDLRNAFAVSRLPFTKTSASWWRTT